MRKGLKGILVICGLVFLTAPAAAHHPLEGVAMTTFWHGLLSGVGHPILGYDHLFFVAAVGLAALFTRHPLLAPLYYVAAMGVGVGLAASGIQLPLVELVIVLSLITVGATIASGREVLPVVFAAFGLFHGAAFGAVIAGQEAALAAVLIGYLIGLAITQWAIAVGVGMAARTLFSVTQPRDTANRLAGAVVLGAGMALLLDMATQAI